MNYRINTMFNEVECRRGRPFEGDYTSPKSIRFDRDLFELLECECVDYGTNISARVREILRYYYRSEGKLT
ncbi:hypothetical protein LEP3755_33980 [Leptolyngbya sp. NIES-3755]|nr:hypothetical protein LEP3755_33980 [Leptolyngbya sp. NIES-3755]